MSTVVKDLGAVSAYAYAVEKGYTGTEAEFAELMADYAEVGQRAEDAADSALESKTAAQTAATTATNKASEATTAATTATNKAAEAQADADAAALDASQALSAASTATTKATEATTAAATATSAATTATTAKDDAVSAKTAAQTAQTGAETAAASVQSSAAQIQTNADDISELKEDLTQKANIDGSYEDLVSGGAYQIISNMEEVDNTPYGYRTAGGSLEIGDREKLKKIVGGSLVVNQIFTHAERTLLDGVTTTFDGQTGIMSSVGETTKAYYFFAAGSTTDASIIGGHKYFVYIDNSRAVRYENNKTGGGIDSIGTYTGAKILAPLNNGRFRLSVYGLTVGTEVNISCRPQFFDLTAMLGTTIADYVYGLETATAGSGVAWLKSHFPRIFNAGYIPYNAGELVSVQASAHKMTGFNQWDEVTEVGRLDVTTGAEVAESAYIRSKNYCKCLPNTVYYGKAGSNPSSFVMCFYDEDKNYVGYLATSSCRNTTFTTPANAYYFRMYFSNNAYNHDICINLHWDGERDGEYEPYEKHSYPLDSDVTLRGIPKLDANNNLYYDGDEYVADGTVTRKYKMLDLSTRTSEMFQWITVTDEEWFGVGLNVSDMTLDRTYRIVASKLFRSSSEAVTTSNNIYGYNGNLYICISASLLSERSISAARAYFTSNPIEIIYPLATPTTEEVAPYTEIQNVSNWGTEEFVTDALVPVGHETAYQPDLRAKIEVAPESPDTDGVYIMQRENGLNSYVALASSATIQDIISRLEALEGSGT